MLALNKIHHIAIICSDYQKSKHFYTETLGLTIVQEIFREERESYKLDLALNGTLSLNYSHSKTLQKEFPDQKQQD